MPDVSKREAPPPPDAHPAVLNIKTVVELERRAEESRSWAETVSDRIARFAGSLGFVSAHLLLFAGWAAWNELAAEAWRFDPYPYGLLTFIVSMEGVLIATFVLIAQNRLGRRTDRRDQLHLQVGLLTEQELTVALRLLRQIAECVGAAPEGRDAKAAEQLARDTNVRDLAAALNREAPAEEDQRPESLSAGPEAR
jgi:uncharacterized membrane protein